MLLRASFLCLEKSVSAIFNFIFPPQCIICGTKNKNYICDRCDKIIKKYESNQFLPEFEDNNKCRSYDKLYYLFRYEKMIRKIMINYKFYSKPYICHFFAFKILNNKKLSQILKKYDYIVPVPMSKTKEKIRGYNQTSLVTEILSNALKIKHNTNLKKTNNALTQSKLNKSDRKANIAGAFYIKEKNCFKNKRVILLDDIYTTGNTIEECARLIKNNGASEIMVIILARDYME